MKNPLVVIVLVAVLAGGAAFYGGMQFQKNQRGVAFGANGMRRFGVQGGAGGVGGASGARAVRGEVLSNDGKTVTVKLQDGSTKLVLVSSATVITEASKASDSALIQGKQVMVFGTDNPDGSVSAQNVSIGDIQGFGGRMGGERPTGGQPTQ
jgi:hypothetical protein